MNYNEFDLKDTETLYELHKTDYNNYADLSHFVDEYNKAQELINECNRFYKSFLRSKLLTYKQLTNNIYKRDINKFYKVKLFVYGADGTPFIPNCDKHKYYPDIAKDFGFNVGDDLNGYYTPYPSGLKILRICELLASLKLQQEYNNSPIRIVLEHCSYNSRICPDYFQYFIKKYRAYDGPHFSFYGNPDRKITKSDLELLGFKTENDLIERSKEYGSVIKKRFAELQKEYLPKVIEYIGSDNIIGINVIYEIANVAINYCKSDEIKTKIAKFVNTNNYKTLNIFDYCDKDIVYNAFYKHLSKIGSWSECECPNEILNELNKNINKITDAIYPEIEDGIHFMQSVIDNSETDIKNNKLYIIDNNHTAQEFCFENELSKVNIHIEDRELVCSIKFDKEKYHHIGQRTTHNIIRKTVIFDVDTNELKKYDVSTSSYEETIRYR